VKVTNRWCWQCWCVCLSLLFGFRASPFSPLFFLSRFLPSCPFTVALFVSKLSSAFSFKRAFSRPKILPSSFFFVPTSSRPFLSKQPSLLPKILFAAGVESSIYRLEGRGLLLRVGSRGAACCCAWGAGHAVVGRPDRGRGALGSVTVPCFKGRGALGSVREEEQCQNDTVQFLFLYIFLILTLFLFYLWGT